MDKLIHYNMLFDIYKELFTENQQKIFKYYYEENYTLQEIGELMSVSRSFISKTINQVTDKLEYYEEKLSLLKIKEKLNSLLDVEKEIDLQKEIQFILNNYY